MQRRTRIVATLGPALDAPGRLEAVLAAGADVLRVNLSHGGPAEQAERVQRARALRPSVGILADLAGPKLRLGELPRDVEVLAGATVVLGSLELPVADPELFARLTKGEAVYVADGTIHLEVLEAREREATCRVVSGGVLRSRKGINLPGDDSPVPSLTAKDLRDIAELGILDPTWVALSHVRSERDVAALRALTSLPIIAKIEKPQAVERFDAILAVSDAVMVARGDLGIEIPIECVPATQKRLIRAANLAGVPVITATQMLLSMVSSPRPTRAEATDVANAVLDGTDAVMLSEETAVGNDPAAAVRMMARLAEETEPLLGEAVRPSLAEDEVMALARTAVQLAAELGVAAIVAPTFTGGSASCLAACRPRRPVLAYSRVPATTRRLALAWGVTATDITVPDGADPLTATLDAARRDLSAGARVLLFDAAARCAPDERSVITVLTL